MVKAFYSSGNVFRRRHISLKSRFFCLKAMAARLVVLASFLALLSDISGRVVSTEKECDPLWTVVGNHYVPRKKCDLTIRDIEEEEFLRYKYMKEFSAGQASPDMDFINELINEMIFLLPWHSQRSLKIDLTCIACSAGVDTYKFLTNAGMKKEFILKLFTDLCIDLKIMSPSVCKGSIGLYGETLMSIIDKSKAKSQYICSILLNTKCGSGDLPDLNWNVTLPNTKKPPVVKPVPPPPSAPKLKVLHITDTHWDTQYVEGSWAECPLPLCCRKENSLPNKNATRAGKYGGWRCDTPEETFDSVLQHIAKQHPDLDYIVWTGDIPAHDIWEQTRAENLAVLKKTVAKLSKTFPNTPLFPALGNHESVPSNMFPTGKGTKENPMDWLFSEVNNQWSRWLPKNVSNTVRLGAFYTTMIRPGLRLVSMNMNYCYNMNWWLINDYKDPLDELQWLVQLLQEAENKKEKVHIIGHIPPGSTECLKAWQTNYYKIINRFEGTVTAQFFGHTHSDEFEIFYDMKNTSRPFGVAYVGPSVTTYMYHNPSYRIYYVEGDYNGTNRFVLDHESWYLNLEKANKENRAEWKKLYSVKDAYKMKSLYPDDWDNFYLRIKNSDEALQQYHKYFWNDSPKRPVCDKNCRRNYLCGIRSCTQYGNPSK